MTPKGRKHIEPKAVPLSAERCYCHSMTLPHWHTLGAHPDFWRKHHAR